MKLAHISRLFRAPGSEGLSNHWFFIFMYFRIFAVRAATHYHTGSWHKLIQEKEMFYPLIILCLQHHLVKPYQVCSNYAPGGQKWPCLGGHMFYLKIHEEKSGFYIFVNIIHV